MEDGHRHCGRDCGPARGHNFVLTPLAIPLLAGPGAFGVVLGLSTWANVVHDYPGFVLGIAFIAVLVAVLLGFGERLFVRLSESGIDVLNRLFGIIVWRLRPRWSYTGCSARN